MALKCWDIVLSPNQLCEYVTEDEYNRLELACLNFRHLNEDVSQQNISRENINPAQASGSTVSKETLVHEPG